MGILRQKVSSTGMVETVDIDNLLIDGKRSGSMTREEMFSACKKLGLLGLDHRMGKQELLEAWFENWTPSPPKDTRDAA